eukprot:m.16089 g.16089  ORF g.16089 m.16089 type:complete len:881 (-) comp4565_c0_seq2:315-2957(-)
MLRSQTVMGKFNQQQLSDGRPSFDSVGGFIFDHMHTGMELSAEMERVFTDEFAPHYCFHFPEDEREDPRDILSRIKSAYRDDQRSYTQVIMARLAGSDWSRSEVAGGIIVEFYPRSEIVILTYVFVRRKFRGKSSEGFHLGQALLDDILRSMIKHIEVHPKNLCKSGQVRCVIFETETPSRTPVVEGVVFSSDAEEEGGSGTVPPEHRLEFFRRVGAKRIPIQYTQPALNDETEAVGNLDLFLLPQGSELDTTSTRRIAAASVMLFLIDINWSLDRYQPTPRYTQAAYDNDIHVAQSFGLQSQINNFKFQDIRLAAEKVMHVLRKQDAQKTLAGDYLLLHEVPRAEKPFLRASTVGICLQYLVDEVDFVLVSPLSDAPCPVFRSFELDVFSSRFQRAPVMKTSFVTVLNIWISFPDNFEFTSEGREEAYTGLYKNLCQHHGVEGRRKLVKARLRISTSKFLRCDNRVWHVTISPAVGSYFDEFDIIKLTKHFNGIQEAVSLEAWHLKTEGILFARRNPRAMEMEPAIVFKPLRDLLFQFDPTRSSKQPAQGSSPPLTMAPSTTTTALAAHYRPKTKAAETKKDPVRLETGLVEIVLGKDKSWVRESVVKGWTNDTVAASLFLELNKPAEDRFCSDPLPEHARKYATIFCGFSLGILDFHRQSLSEINDTLVPRDASLTSNYATIVGRGRLFSLTVDDEADNDEVSPMQTTEDTIGFNPYLMITSAVVVNNFSEVRRAHNLLDEVGSQLTKAKTYAKSHACAKSIDDIMQRIHKSYLSNVFNYDNEQDLYTALMGDQDIFQEFEEVKQLAMTLEGNIQHLRERSIAQHETRFELILGLVGVAGVSGVLFDFIDDHGQASWASGALIVVLTILLLLSVGFGS